MDQEQEYMTTIWENIKCRVKFLRESDMLFGDGVEWAKAIVEELERIYKKLDSQDKRSDHHIALINGLMNKKPDPPQEELKPCPFCNGTTIKLFDEKEYDSGVKVNYYCGTCHISGPAGYDNDTAIKNWNRRSNA